LAEDTQEMILLLFVTIMLKNRSLKQLLVFI